MTQEAPSGRALSNIIDNLRRDYVLKSEAWDGAQASYRKGLAAGRRAGLREAAEVLRAQLSSRSYRSGEKALAAILALAEGKEG